MAERSAYEAAMDQAKSLRIQREEHDRLRRAAKRVLEQYASDGGHGSTLAFEDAIRELEAALHWHAPTELPGEESSK